MNLEGLKDAKDEDERKRTIRTAFEEEAWEDHLESVLEHGGRPADAHLEWLNVDQSAVGLEFREVTIGIDFTEETYTGCDSVQVCYQANAELRFEVDCENEDVLDWEVVSGNVDDDFYVGDYT